MVRTLVVMSCVAWFVLMGAASPNADQTGTQSQQTTQSAGTLVNLNTAYPPFTGPAL